MSPNPEQPRVLDLEEVRLSDVEQVGGKNASLGELIGCLSQAGVEVPGGFATTADAFREFLEQDALGDRISGELAALEADDVQALARCGRRIRQWILETPFPEALSSAVADAYRRHAARYGEGVT